MKSRDDGRDAALRLVASFKKTSAAAAAAATPPPPGLPDELASIQALAGKSLDFSAVEAAIKGIKLQTQATDLSPVADAIGELMRSAAVNTGPIVEAIGAISSGIDLSQVEKELKGIQQTLLNSNAIMLRLVSAVTAEKMVTYDGQGRVSSIQVKTAPAPKTKGG